METTLEESMSRLIRKEFDSLEWWQTDRSIELIKYASDLGFNDLVEEMKNDL